METIKRVKYQKCPLLEVKYQLNFPTILSIDEEEPAKFQELIRSDFPNYKMQRARESEIRVNIKDEEVNPIFHQNTIQKIHHFISEDGKWQIILSKNELSISTLEYNQWEEMKRKFANPLQKFIEIYNQRYFERVSLRYIDGINRNELNLNNTKWKDLIKPHLLGCLAMDINEHGNLQVKANIMNAEITLDDISVKISSGLGTVNKIKKFEGESFILDFDYFKLGKVEFNELEEITTRLHEKSTIFFRNSITEKLHEAMVPEEIEV